MRVWCFVLLLSPPHCSSSCCSSYSSSSLIIICSHYTIWTNPWDCPCSSICSNLYHSKGPFLNCPWLLFIPFNFFNSQTSFYSQLQTSWYNSCRCSLLTYIPWLWTYLWYLKQIAFIWTLQNLPCTIILVSLEVFFFYSHLNDLILYVQN